jgi:hypothetical protein
MIDMTLPGKPNSRLQKYQLTVKDQDFILNEGKDTYQSNGM